MLQNITNGILLNIPDSILQKMYRLGHGNLALATVEEGLGIVVVSNELLESSTGIKIA